MPRAPTTTTDVAVGEALSGRDPETCELTFSIVSGPAHGTLGSIGGAACASGSPNTDSASVTYTPTTGYSGPDSFTYKVNDGTTDSPPATATLTVNGGPDETPPTRGSAVVFGATLEVTYDEPLDTGSVPTSTDFAVAGQRECPRGECRHDHWIDGDPDPRQPGHRRATASPSGTRQVHRRSRTSLATMRRRSARWP